MYPAFLAAADLNGDGGTDLAVPDAYLGTVSVMLNLPVIGIFPNALNFGTEKVGVKSNPLTDHHRQPERHADHGQKADDQRRRCKRFCSNHNLSVSPRLRWLQGASCSVVVTFTPKATGARNATLKITDSVPGSPQLVGLGGTGQ